MEGSGAIQHPEMSSIAIKILQQKKKSKQIGGKTRKENLLPTTVHTD